MNTPIPTVDPDMPQFLKPVDPVDSAATPAAAAPAVVAPVVAPVPPKPFTPPSPIATTAPTATPKDQPQAVPLVSPTPEPPKGFKEKVKIFVKKDTTKVFAGTLVITLFLCLIAYLLLPVPAGKITAEISQAQLATKAAKAEVEALIAENKEAWEWYKKALDNEKSNTSRADVLSEDKAKLIAANIALDQQVKEAWQQWTELNTQVKMSAATQALKKPAAVANPASTPSKSNDQEESGVRVTVEADGTKTTSSGYRRYTIPRTAENLAKMTNGDPEQKLGFDRKNKVWRFRDQDPRDGMSMEEFTQWANEMAASRGKKNFRFVEGEKTRAAIQAGADPFDRPVRQ